MQYNRRTKILIGTLAFVAVCLIAAWFIYLEIEAWADYDPKEAALGRTKQYLEAAYANPTSEEKDVFPSCGGMWTGLDCWLLIQEAVLTSSNNYTMSVEYYNLEDEHPPWRDVDEIIVQVNFENDRPVLMFFYEGCINYCIYQPEDWNLPRSSR